MLEVRRGAAPAALVVHVVVSPCVPSFAAARPLVSVGGPRGPRSWRPFGRPPCRGCPGLIPGQRPGACRGAFACAATCLPAALGFFVARPPLWFWRVALARWAASDSAAAARLELGALAATECVVSARFVLVAPCRHRAGAGGRAAPLAAPGFLVGLCAGSRPTAGAHPGARSSTASGSGPAGGPLG